MRIVDFPTKNFGTSRRQAGSRLLLRRRGGARSGECPPADRLEVGGSGRLRAGQAVVREEDEPGGAKLARGLDVVDGLRGGEAVGADAGPDRGAAGDVARRRDLLREARRFL